MNMLYGLLYIALVAALFFVGLCVLITAIAFVCVKLLNTGARIVFLILVFIALILWSNWANIGIPSSYYYVGPDEEESRE